MVLRGRITQIDKDSKTAKIRYESCNRVRVNYAGYKEENTIEAQKVFEPVLLDSLMNNVEILVHIDEEWNIVMVQYAERGKFVETE